MQKITAEAFQSQGQGLPEPQLITPPISNLIAQWHRALCRGSQHVLLCSYPGDMTGSGLLWPREPSCSIAPSVYCGKQWLVRGLGLMDCSMRHHPINSCRRIRGHEDSRDRPSSRVYGIQVAHMIREWKKLGLHKKHVAWVHPQASCRGQGERMNSA